MDARPRTLPEEGIELADTRARAGAEPARAPEFGRTRPERPRGMHIPRPVPRMDLRIPVLDRLGFSFLRLTVLFLVILGIALLINAPLDGPLNYYLTYAWSLFLPLVVIGVIGATAVRKRRTSRFSGTVSSLVIFFIPTVARRDVLPALHRVVDSILLFAPANLRNFRIDLVADQGSDGLEELRTVYGGHPNVRLIIVPASYRTPRGAIHKARASHYATLVRDASDESTPGTFVYHLDDDTGVGPDTIASIAEFIAEDDGTYDLAQGVLAFPHHLTASRISAYADSIRPGDDLTRFRFFTGLVGRPFGGLHGEHLLVRASVESEIGWDFPDTKVEDAHFGMRFAARRHRSKALDSCSYGASPANLRDLIRQRRRWASGLIQLVFDREVSLRTKWALAYSVFVWITGFFHHTVLILALAFAIGPEANTSPVLAAVIPIWAVTLAYILTQYLEGLRVNLATTKGRRAPRWLAAILMVPGFYVLTAIEALGGLLGLKDAIAGRRDFEVISKPV